MANKLIQIRAPHFVAGYDIENDRIAPIIKYMRGWSMEKIGHYCKKKRWIVEILD